MEAAGGGEACAGHHYGRRLRGARGEHPGDLGMGCMVLLPLWAGLGRAEHERKTLSPLTKLAGDWQVHGAAVPEWKAGLGQGVRTSFQGKN